MILPESGHLDAEEATRVGMEYLWYAGEARVLARCPACAALPREQGLLLSGRDKSSQRGLRTTPGPPCSHALPKRTHAQARRKAESSAPWPTESALPAPWARPAELSPRRRARLAGRLWISEGGAVGSAAAAAGLPSRLRSPSCAPFLATVKEQRVGGLASESPPSLCLRSQSQTRAPISQTRTPAWALLLPLSPSTVVYMTKLSPPST